jgi:hypothetical protein
MVLNGKTTAENETRGKLKRRKMAIIDKKKQSVSGSVAI